MRARDIPEIQRWLSVFQACVGLALVGMALAHLRLFLMAMSSTGLWSDEITSIEFFSSQGLWTTLTTYPAPNNHIFFNALTSVLPWSDVYSPVIARFWSFLATLSLAIAGAWAFAKRRSLLEAGILLHLLLLSHELLALTLQARGYGLLALFAMLSGIFVWRHERNPERFEAIAALGVVCWLGMWTMPSYVLFAGPVMLLTALSGPKLRNILFGFATVCATIAVYLPVLPEVLSLGQAYGSDWGHQLDTIDKVIYALRLYLFDDASFIWGPNDVMIGLLWLLLACLTLRERSTPESRAARTLVASGLLLIALAYLAGTPPPRVLAPGVIVFAFSVALVFRDRLPPGTAAAPKRALIALALAVIVLPADARILRRFEFVPRERWKSIAEFIEMNLPQDMSVAVPFRAEQLMLYTHPEARINFESEPDSLFAGRSAMLVNGLDPRASDLEVVGDPRFATVRFKQNRGRHQTLYLAPPKDTLIKQLTLIKRAPRDEEMQLESALDRDLETHAMTVRSTDPELRYVQFRAELEAGSDPRSLFLIFEEGTTVGRVRVQAHFRDGSTFSLPQSQIVEWGSSVIVNFANFTNFTNFGEWDETRTNQQSIESLTLSIRPHSYDGERHFSLRELWFYPARLKPIR